MTVLSNLFLAAVATLSLAACASPAKPVPAALATEQPPPLADGITPLTVEQDEEIKG